MEYGVLAMMRFLDALTTDRWIAVLAALNSFNGFAYSVQGRYWLAAWCAFCSAVGVSMLLSVRSTPRPGGPNHD